MSSTLTPYTGASGTISLVPVAENANGAMYLVSGRAMNLPYSMTVARKLTAPSAAGNDSVSIRLARCEANATSGKLATMAVTLTVSIPKDQTVHTVAEQKKMLCAVASLLNESTAMEATTVFMTALLEGRNP